VAGPAHTITSYTTTGTDTLREQSVHYLWPEWASFLAVALILLMVITGVVWIARGIARRTRRA